MHPERGLRHLIEHAALQDRELAPGVPAKKKLACNSIASVILLLGLSVLA